MAPPSTAAKRHAADKAEGESRPKRKKVDNTAGVKRTEKGQENDGKTSLVDFSSMPTEALHRYLAHYDIIPFIHPTPLSPDDPPPPSSLLNNRHSSRGASPPVQSHRREPNRRRSSRLLEEETRHRAPVLTDVQDVHDVLATIAQRHFREQTLKEVDTLASFMCSVKSKVSV